MKRKRHFTFFIFAALIAAVAIAAKAQNVRVPFPSSRDVRRILTPADLTPEDNFNLRPANEALHYYHERFRTNRQANNKSYILSESYFITLLPLDFKGMARFADKILGPEGGLKSVDSFMSAIPNLIVYLRQISVGEIKKQIEPQGQFQRVTLYFTLDERAVARRYPAIAGKMTGHLQNLWMELRNTDTDLLIRLDYAQDKARIKFILDPRGYFVATGPDGNPILKTGKNLGLEDVKHGARLYFDMGFSSRITLIKLLKLLVFEVKRVRAEIKIRLEPNRLNIGWKVIEVTPGNINIIGMDTAPISDSLANYKGTLKGTMDFMPMPIPAGQLTFMRIFTNSEQVDQWLVHIAILTWDDLVSKLMSDLSVPISEAMVALRRDVKLQSREPQ